MTSGTYRSNGYDKISSADECDEAAKTLNFISDDPLSGYEALDQSGAYGNSLSSCTVATILAYGRTDVTWNSDEGEGGCDHSDADGAQNCICKSTSLWSGYVVNGFRVSNDGENCECHTHVPESSSECTETATTFKTFKITPYVFKDYKYEKVADSICIQGTMGTRVVAYSGNIPGKYVRAEERHVLPSMSEWL